MGRVDFVHCVEEWFSLPPIRGKGKPLLGALDGNLAVVQIGIATVRSTAQVSLEMGNSDEMLHGFYNNPRTLAEGEAWFDFLPLKAKVRAPYLYLNRFTKNLPNFEGSKQSNPSKAHA